MTITYPHSIDNGQGEKLTFIRRVLTPRGEALEVENWVQPGVGPPMHMHLLQEEALTVQRGSIGYQRKGQSPQFAGPGETVVFPPGDWHRFWNAGEDELHCTGYVLPPDNIEFFLGTIFDSQKRSGSARPDAFDAAFLMRRYRSEYRMDGIPGFVTSVVMPLQVLVGHLLGKYRKFADAPPAARARRIDV